MCTFRTNLDVHCEKSQSRLYCRGNVWTVKSSPPLNFGTAVVRAKREQLSTRDSLVCINSLELFDVLLEYD